MNDASQGVFAALPILIILVTMLGFRWSAAKAGATGLVACLLLVWFLFTPISDAAVELTPAFTAVTAGALAEALFTAFTILWIIFPALCIYELQMQTGALETLRGAMARLSGDPRLIALLVAWFFVLFMEGAAGFGTSAALAAPFLVSAGFNRLDAVIIVLVGHAVGVSFGAVGTPIIPQVSATDYSGLELAAAAGFYHAVLGWIMPLIVVLLVARSTRGTAQKLAPAVAWALFAGAAFLVPFYLLARFVGPELPTLGGALVGGSLFVAALVLSRRWRGEAGETNGDVSVKPHVLVVAAAPYLVLIVLILASRLVPALRQMLSATNVGWQVGDFGGQMAPLYHPGTMLLISFGVGAVWQRVRWRGTAAAMGRAARRLLPVTLALLAMLSLSRLMVHAGMIEAMAQSAAAAAGPTWPMVAPFIGALGTFVTGSATASNILFTDFQQSAAARLNLPALPLLGAQTFGAAVGNIVCPHNIIAANATVQIAGQEGEVLRRTFGIMCCYGLLGGLLALLLLS